MNSSGLQVKYIFYKHTLYMEITTISVHNLFFNSGMNIRVKHRFDHLYRYWATLIKVDNTMKRVYYQFWPE